MSSGPNCDIEPRRFRISRRWILGLSAAGLILVSPLVYRLPASSCEPPCLTVSLDGPLEFGKTVLLKDTEYGSSFVEPRSFMLVERTKGLAVAVTLRFRGPEVVPVCTIAVEVVLEDKGGDVLMRGTKIAGDARPGARRPKRIGSITPAVSSATTVSLPLDPSIRDRVQSAKIRFVECQSSPEK